MEYTDRKNPPVKTNLPKEKHIQLCRFRNKQNQSAA